MNRAEEIHRQLRNVGHNNWFLGQPEVRQLPHILFNDEVIHRIVTGGCPDGFAVMVATNQRLLLINKAPFTLNVEDFPYEHINNAEYHFGFFFGALRISTLSRELVFRRINPRKVSRFAKFVHYKIREATERLRQVNQDLNTKQNQPGALGRLARAASTEAFKMRNLGLE